MTTESDIRVETWKPVAPMDGCTFSGYEVSDRGQARSVDRTSGGRKLKGKQLALSRHDDGYRLVTIRCDSTDPGHKRAHTFTVHKVVLYTFAGPPGRGEEACHSPRGPAFNWWPGGVRWGTKPENHADQVATGTAVMPEPTFPCRNAQNGCPNLVKNEGRRCRDCVRAVGVDVAAMLRAGKTIEEASERFGNSPDWLFRLAAEHGGFAGTIAEVRAVPHTPCQCPACVASRSAPPSRGVFARLASAGPSLAATLRSRSRSATR